MSKLTALEVEKQQSPGRYADGNGLYLEVTKAGTKTWLFRYLCKRRGVSFAAAGLVAAARALDSHPPLLGHDPGADSATTQGSPAET